MHTLLTFSMTSWKPLVSVSFAVSELEPSKKIVVAGVFGGLLAGTEECDGSSETLSAGGDLHQCSFNGFIGGDELFEGEGLCYLPHISAQP